MMCRSWIPVVASLSLIAPTAGAGNRLAALDALNAVEGNWPEANLEVEVRGITADGEAVLGTQIKYAYRSAQPGHLYLVHVSSHGEMTLLRGGGAAAISGESDAFQVTEPLGAETAYVLLAASPLNELLPAQQDMASLGDDGSAAQVFADTLAGLSGSNRFAIGRLDYEVVGQAGQTEHTTRGIERVLAQMVAVSTAPSSEQSRGSPSGAGPRVAAGEATIPTRVGFEFNSSQLTKQGKRDLDIFGEVMLRPQWQSLPVVLAGHTDDVGADEYNMDLSRRRAEAAKAYLVQSFGIEPARLTVVAYGETQPAVPNASDAGRAQNRRVEFIFRQPAP